MKTYATGEKQSAPGLRKVHPYVHHPLGPAQQERQMEIQRILHTVGAKASLTIGQPNDKYEQEADRIADQVMAMPDPKLKRQPENESELVTNRRDYRSGQTLLDRDPTRQDMIQRKIAVEKEMPYQELDLSILPEAR